MNSINDLSGPKNLHGVFLNIFNKGILLTGKSGMGKSECALALLDRHHQLICDDAPVFEVKNNQLIGHAPDEIANLLEVRGLGIINVQQLFGKQAIQKSSALDLIIELNAPLAFDEPRRINKELINKQIMGVSIPHLTVSVMLKHHMAILIETAVKLVFPSDDTAKERILDLVETHS